MTEGARQGYAEIDWRQRKTERERRRERERERERENEREKERERKANLTRAGVSFGRSGWHTKKTTMKS